jgi:predicted ArsR family transcriptional regulator
MQDSEPIPPDVIEVSSGDRDHVDDWKEHTQSIDRVISVALTLDQPRTADQISDRAHVSPSTARAHLDRLVDLHVLTAVEQRGTKTYQPDSAYQHFTEISKLVEAHSRDELEEITIGAKEDIEELQEQYDCEEPAELRSLATDPDTSAADAKEYFKRASEWDHHLKMLSLTEEALERYGEFSDGADSTDGSRSPLSA